MKQQLIKAKNTIYNAVNDTALDYAWLKTKDQDGNHQNLKCAINEVSKNLTSPKLATIIISTTLASCIMGGIFAFKSSAHSYNFHDMKMSINKPSKNHDNLKTYLQKSFTAAHENAPYKKYMIKTALSTNTLIIFGACGTSIRKKRKEDNCNDPDNGLS